MPTRPTVMIVAGALLSLGSAVASASGIDDLRGKFGFDWHLEPSATECTEIDDDLMARFKSKEFTCDLEAHTNSASEHPVQVCTSTSGIGEHLIFKTKAECEDERETQAASE
ncbi:MAG: hypothetical protein R3D57_04435 [Hyphomicrobiaceae bacterium]